MEYEDRKQEESNSNDVWKRNMLKMDTCDTRENLEKNFDHNF